MSRHFKITLCCLVLFLAALRLAFFKPIPYTNGDVNGADAICNSFLSYLKANQIKDAYALLTPQLQNIVSERQLEKLWKLREKKRGKLQGWYLPHNAGTHKIHQPGTRAGQNLQVNMKLRLYNSVHTDEFSPGAADAEFTCVFQNNKWLIDAFNFE